MLEPNQIVDEVRQRLHLVQPLNVFWVTVSADRDDLVRKLKKVQNEIPIVPWILRSSGFSDPNSVMNDVIDILNQAREDIEVITQTATRWNCIALILLSRRELKLAVASSPILLPDWFPLAPGQTITARIDELTWSVSVPISDKVSGLDDLRRLLYEIDDALIQRLEVSLIVDHKNVQSLWSQICREDDGKIVIELHKAKSELHKIQNPTGYRPSTMSPTVVGRIWYKVNRTTPDQLLKIARSLAQALDLENGTDYDDVPLISVLNRPSNPIVNSYERWSFGLIMALRGACQLVTAAAHADEYGRYPVYLLRSVSLDFRRFLDTAVAALRRSTSMTDAGNDNP